VKLEITLPPRVQPAVAALLESTLLKAQPPAPIVRRGNTLVQQVQPVRTVKLESTLPPRVQPVLAVVLANTWAIRVRLLPFTMKKLIALFVVRLEPIHSVEPLLVRTALLGNTCRMRAPWLICTIKLRIA
jgi:hypothetical protein